MPRFRPLLTLATLAALALASPSIALAGPGHTLSLKSKVKARSTDTDIADAFRFVGTKHGNVTFTAAFKGPGGEVRVVDPTGEEFDLTSFEGVKRTSTKIKIKALPLDATGYWTVLVDAPAGTDFALKLKGRIRKSFDAVVQVPANGRVLLPVSVPDGGDVHVKAVPTKGSAAQPRFGTIARVDLSLEGTLTPTLHKAYALDLRRGDLQLPLDNIGGTDGELSAKVRIKGWKPRKQKLDLRDVTPLIAPNPDIDDTTSHARQSSNGRDDHLFAPLDTGVSNGNFHIVTYGDFDGDGDLDAVQSGSDTFNRNRSLFFRRNAQGELIREDSFLQGGPGLFHPKKGLVADFDGNGFDDIVILAHGTDRAPFPGETNALFLSDGTRLVYSDALESFPGFFHSGACGDVDNDGDVDLFMGVPHEPYFLMNDGKAGFTEDRERITARMSDFFTSELVDIDGDGYLDILSGGEEAWTGPPQIVWGNDQGTFREVTDLPTMPGMEVVLDADVADLDRDGHNDIVLTRTGGGLPGGPTNYDGFFVQYLRGGERCTFVDATAQIDTPGNWGYRDAGTPQEQLLMSEVGRPPLVSGYAGWNSIAMGVVQLQDVNDDDRIDIVEQQPFRNAVWLNNPDGTFSAQFELTLGTDPDFTLLR